MAAASYHLPLSKARSINAMKVEKQNKTKKSMDRYAILTFAWRAWAPTAVGA